MMEQHDETSQTKEKSITIMIWRSPISNQCVLIFYGNGILFSFSSCIVCALHDVQLSRLSSQQRHWTFLERGIFVSEGCQSCVDHLHERHLSFDALNAIRRHKRIALNYTVTESSELSKTF